MDYTRREFGKLALAAATLPAVGANAAGKPVSTFGGVRVGIITYSFRELPGSAEETLKYCLDCGIDGVELMAPVAEDYAGAPAQPWPPFPRPRPATPAPGAPAAPPPGPPQFTPEQREELRKRAEALKAWRLSAPMAKFDAFRRMYEDAGVKIYAFKLPPTLEMSDEEYAYIWNVAERLGADHITMELPTDDALLQRVAAYAEKRKLRIAFHTHGQGGASGFDRALSASPYTALNFDVGHYFGVNGESPVPLVEKYHDRIASLHLKDRQAPPAGQSGEAARGGPNMPWGQGGTPLAAILQSMKAHKYPFPASIEYEYQTPAGSDVLTEIKKCVDYCRKALG